MNTSELYVAPYSSSVAARADRKLILSVDDELGVLFSRFKLLAAAGFAVISASDGVQALGIFGAEKIDLVLLDYNLPEMHGGLVAEAMKAHRPDIPVMMVSADGVPPEFLSFCDQHILKATGPEHLLHCVRTLLFPTVTPDTDRSQQVS